MAKYNRILLKLSGESLMGKQNFGIDPERLADYARQIKEVSEMGVQIGIVIGGGNIFRGLSGSQKGFDRVKGDQMGMCATTFLLTRPPYTIVTTSSMSASVIRRPFTIFVSIPSCAATLVARRPPP